MSYVPLWCKSHFSFLEGASRPDELVEQAHAFGLPALALTDRDGVHGAVRAHVRARELGLSLVLGAEVTVGAEDRAGATGSATPELATHTRRPPPPACCSRPTAPATPTSAASSPPAGCGGRRGRRA